VSWGWGLVFGGWCGGVPGGVSRRVPTCPVCRVSGFWWGGQVLLCLGVVVTGWWVGWLLGVGECGAVVVSSPAVAAHVAGVAEAGFDGGEGAGGVAPVVVAVEAASVALFGWGWCGCSVAAEFVVEVAAEVADGEYGGVEFVVVVLESLIDGESVDGCGFGGAGCGVGGDFGVAVGGGPAVDVSAFVVGELFVLGEFEGE